jgi:Peptidase of plants and bacteria
VFESIGIYEPNDKRLYVRGTTLSPEVRSILVHELTHAWQDQLLGINMELPTSPDERTALKALVEGDATFVQRTYEATLTKAVDRKDESDRSQKSLASYDRSRVYLEYLPYLLGPSYIKEVHEYGGNDAVNKLFSDPPKRIAEIFSRDAPHEPIAKFTAPYLPGETVLLLEELDTLSFFSLIGERQNVSLTDHAADFDGALLMLSSRDQDLCGRLLVRSSWRESLMLPPASGATAVPDFETYLSSKDPSEMVYESCLPVASTYPAHPKEEPLKPGESDSMGGEFMRWSVRAALSGSSKTKVNTDVCIANATVDVVAKKAMSSSEPPLDLAALALECRQATQ